VNFGTADQAAAARARVAAGKPLTTVSPLNRNSARKACTTIRNRT